MVLKVSPQEMEIKAQQIQAKRTEMGTCLEGIYNFIKGLRFVFWLSISGMAFYENFMKVYKECQDALLRIDQYIANLKEAATEYRTLEDQQKQRVSALNTPDIF